MPHAAKFKKTRLHVHTDSIDSSCHLILRITKLQTAKKTVSHRAICCGMEKIGSYLQLGFFAIYCMTHITSALSREEIIIVNWVKIAQLRKRFVCPPRGPCPRILSVQRGNVSNMINYTRILYFLHYDYMQP